MRSSASAPAAPTARTRPSSMTTDASSMMPSGPRPRAGSFVIERADVVDHQRPSGRLRCHQSSSISARSTAPSSRATSMSTWCPSATIVAPVDDDVGDVARRRREHDAVSTASAAPTPAVRTESSDTVTRSARLPHRDRTGVVPPETPVAVGRRPRQQIGDAWHAAPERPQSLVELDGPRFLEQVDHGVRVAAERDRDAERGQCRRTARSRRRGRVRWSGTCTRSSRPSNPMSAAVRWVAWTAVNRGPEEPRSSSSTAVGVDAVAPRDTCSFSAGCSETWAWITAVAVLRPTRPPSAIAFGVDGAHRVDRDTDVPGVSTRAAALDPLGPRVERRGRRTAAARRRAAGSRRRRDPRGDTACRAA